MRPGGRHRKSTIDRLEPEIRALISELRIEHGWTIDEILARLKELGANPSRSALGRHVKSLEEVGAQLRKSREIARALVREAGDQPEDRLADLNIELMHSMILQIVTATERGEDGPAPVTFSPEDAMFMGRALAQLATARKTDADRARKAREDAKKELMEKVEKVAKAPGAGLSAATVQQIRQAVLGDA